MTSYDPLQLISVRDRVQVLDVHSDLFQSLIQNRVEKRVVLVQDNEVWLNESLQFPYISELKKLNFSFSSGKDNKRQTCIKIDDFLFLTTQENQILNLKKFNFRQVLDGLEGGIVPNLLLGTQTIKWSESSLFCSRCGHTLSLVKSEVAKICSSCSFTYYPTIAPVAIALIYRNHGDRTELLLARSLRSKTYFSCVAGFVEAGENIETCVRREILEELGVLIKPPCYFGSQSWPFPSQLMIGFLAEWDSGEINVDPNELAEAAWFSILNLPPTPPKISIAGKMIAHFTAQQFKG